MKSSRETSSGSARPALKVPQSRLATTAWFFLAVVSCLWVYWLNGVPLIYEDTGIYLYLGNVFLETAGLLDASGAGAAAEAASTVGGEAGTRSDDGMVQASRALAYGVFLVVVGLIFDYSAVVYLQAIALILTVYIVCSAALRAILTVMSGWQVTALMLVAASLGSAPFYVAFLMPDIFAPILILAVAGLATLGRNMKLWEICVLVALGAGTVPMHLSHLGIALGLIPVSVVAAWLTGGQRWWLAGLLAALIASVGLLERVSFETAVEKGTDSEVVYVPYITARLIVDGPGKEFLDEECPEIGLATCKLNEKLDRPSRLTATHITFGVGEEHGSFTLLSPEEQKQVANEQIKFLITLAKDRPLDLANAGIRNIVRQLRLVSIDHTIPTESTQRRVRTMFPEAPQEWSDGFLAQSRKWLDSVSTFHSWVYGISGLALIGLILMPRSRVPAQMRGLGVVILLGILGNAILCGALSQPADRYGARVMFLLPAGVALLLCTRYRVREPFRKPVLPA